MKEIWPFLLAHWPLSLAFITTLLAVVFSELRERQSGGRQVNCTELTRLMNHEKGVVVDVRVASEFAQGHILGALNITLDSYKDYQAKLQKFASRPIILVDNNGTRLGAMLKLFAKDNLAVSVLAGGLTAWRQEGLPLTTVDN